MSHPSEYPEQLDDQSMGSHSNGLPAVAPVVPSAIEEPRTSLVPQEVHPPQEALFGDMSIFIHAPQFHWHDYEPETMCRAFVDSVVFLVTPCEFPIFLNIGHMQQGRLLSDGGPRCHRNTHQIGGSRQ